LNWLEVSNNPPTTSFSGNSGPGRFGVGEIDGGVGVGISVPPLSEQPKRRSKIKIIIAEHMNIFLFT